MHDLALIIAESSNFVSGKALGTFAGASTATVVVGNTARYLLKKDVVVLPFFIALGFAALQSSLVGASWSDVGTYFLVLLNGCVLFCAAIGANQTLVSVVRAEERGRIKAQGAQRLPWLSPWI